MKATLKYIKKVYGKIIHSIAFYPVLISSTFLILALATLYFETRELADLLKESLPSLYIQHTETARTILSTVIGGILSLTVFSFSMVMVVLNQASSSYSPRLLPGLISDKKHQIILGIYTGTLLYCLLILTSLGSYNSSEDSVGFSTMLGAIFGIVCVALFVYFIHNISVVIQIDHIIDKITDRSNQFLDKRLSCEEEIESMRDEWKVIYSTVSGYYSHFDSDLLPEPLKKQKNSIEIIPFHDEHIWEGDPLFKVKHRMTSEEIKQIELCFNLTNDRHQGDSYTGGMIKLMEIAVKAMSPGINDPGTAIDVITRLGLLIRKVLKIPPSSICQKDQLNLKIIQTNIAVNELFQIIVQPIRHYSRHDCSVLLELAKALLFVERTTQNEEAKKIILSEIKVICTTLESSELDKADINKTLQLINA